MFGKSIRLGLLGTAVLLMSGRAESQNPYMPGMYPGSQGYGQGAAVQFFGRAIFVYAHDYSFAPSTLSVPPGTVVHWINVGKHIHTVTSNAAFFHSGDMPPGSIYSVMFTQLGTYEYYCRHHEEHKMRGTINVRVEPWAPPGY